ncbi:pyruvate kinase [Cytophagaceae bacterium DM2B3-1]|uniref:Pyruvate kinase n=1 Tax=Xanthocytophaga flava TaxID=3048013 RepID=A0ABT7CTI2_9BACT|nr:pyruvate kinase [Xanthocytophaga flavus]MDJ1468044.1 pyruvate kinase [Xanthocytophaga flavus]MDJ1495939.1 pyruvate kinase [Xanthocytophaga flavus]
MNIPFNKTKVIATVGPASNTKEKLLQLIQAGVDVFRLNFSHGSHEDHLKVVQFVRELNQEHKLNIGLLQDLQGPKIRTREVENNGVELRAGNKLVITTEKIIGTSERISTTYVEMADDVNIGERILLDDGKLELRVTDINKSGEYKEVITEVVYGGILKSKKGINLPNTNVSIPALTEKDREDLIFGLEHNLDWIALSFVRTAEEVLEMKEIIKSKGRTSRVVSKIEKPEAIVNIDAIIAASDAIMIARGDLGVEVPAEEVPMIQKMIADKCNKSAKPVIVATQMLESMITSPRPTRAETSDIANAVIDGADTVMLSAETASGMYPVEAVRSMTETIRQVEERANIYYKNHAYAQQVHDQNFYSNNVVVSACRLARDTDAQAIVGLTMSGYTALRISSHRPKSQIFVFTFDETLLNTLSLVWGIRAYYYDNSKSTDEIFEDIKDILVRDGHVKTGDVIINTGSIPVSRNRHTNMLKLSIV